MLKIKDRHGRTKFILTDDAEEPISIDDLVLQEVEERQKVKKEKANANEEKSK